MLRRPPRSTRTITRCPCTTLFRSIPGFRRWLAALPEPELAAAFTPEDLAELPAQSEDGGLKETVRALLGDDRWAAEPKLAAALQRPLMVLAARYLVAKRGAGQPLDSVARFPLHKGADRKSAV